MQSDFTIFLEVQLTDLRRCIAAKHQECLRSLESELMFLRSEQHILHSSQDLERSGGFGSTSSQEFRMGAPPTEKVLSPMGSLSSAGFHEERWSSSPSKRSPPAPGPHPNPVAPEGSPHFLHSLVQPLPVQNVKTTSTPAGMGVSGEARSAWGNSQQQRCHGDGPERRSKSKDNGSKSADHAHDYHNYFTEHQPFQGHHQHHHGHQQHHHGHQPHHHGHQQAVQQQITQSIERHIQQQNHGHNHNHHGPSIESHLHQVVDEQNHPHSHYHQGNHSQDISAIEDRLSYLSNLLEKHITNSARIVCEMPAVPIANSAAWGSSFTDMGWGANTVKEQRRSRVSVLSMRQRESTRSCDSSDLGRFDEGLTGALPHEPQHVRGQEQRFSINSVQSRVSQNWGATLSSVSTCSAPSRPKKCMGGFGGFLQSVSPSVNDKAVPELVDKPTPQLEELQESDPPSASPSTVPSLGPSEKQSAPSAVKGANGSPLVNGQMSLRSNTQQGIRSSKMYGVRMSNMPTVTHMITNDSSSAVYRIWPIWHDYEGADLHNMESEDHKHESDNGDDDSDSSEDMQDIIIPGKKKSVTGLSGRKERKCCKRGIRSLMLQPSSTPRMMWDPIGFLIICYEFVVVPLDFFELPEENFFSDMQWFMRAYWSVDCPLSFFTGYQRSDGNLEMRPSFVAKNYIVTWFPFDVTILAFDWAELCFNFDGMGTARIGKTLKTLRLLRMVRLVRLIRLRRLPDFVKAAAYKFHSERFVILGGIARIMIVLVGIAHLIACVWYGVGVSGENEESWVYKSGVRRSKFGLKYTTSMHWSLSQFTGTSDILPVNFGERSYAVFCMLLGFLVSASVVSSITSSMTRLQIVTARQSTQVSMLRQYLFDNGISSKVALRVQRNAMFSLEQEKKNTPESQIELLSLVSEPLRVELHYEIYGPTLCWHPFFKYYNLEVPAGIRRVCHKAVTKLLLARGDVLFSGGEVPAVPTMYFVLSGKLSYTPNNKMSSRFRKQHIQANQWAVELVLWTPWVHVGTMTARSECCIMLLDAQEFQECVTQYRGGKAKLYAEEFVNRLNDLEPGFLSDTDQLPIDLEEMCSQIFTRPALHRQWSMTKSGANENQKAWSPWTLTKSGRSGTRDFGDLASSMKGMFAGTRSQTFTSQSSRSS